MKFKERGMKLLTNKERTYLYVYIMNIIAVIHGNINGLY